MKFQSYLSAFALILGVTVLNPSLAVEAQAKERPDRLESLKKELSLTPQQVEQVKAVRAKYKDRMEKQHQAAQEAHQDLVSRLKAPKRGPEYRAELMDKFKKSRDLKRGQELTRFEKSLEIRELLTDEQIAKFKGFRGHHGHKLGGKAD